MSSQLTSADGDAAAIDVENSPNPTLDGRRVIGSAILARLGRVTTGGRFVPCIDGLRCLAIFAVLLYHLNGFVVGKAIGLTEQEARNSVIFHWLHGANCGVQIFFSISGFILALPFAREISGGRKVSLSDYYLRRLTRLEPPFLVNLTIAFSLLVLGKKEAVVDLVAPMLATITYTHNWFYGELSRINGVAWSLEIEVQFYILAPFLTRAFFGMKAQQRRVFLTTLIVCLVSLKMLVLIDGSLRLRLGLLYVLDHFLVGILMADVFVFSWNESPKQSFRWDLLTIPVIVLLFGIQRSDVLLHLLPFLTIGLLVCVFRGRTTNRLFSVPAVVVIGGMCYSIYLYHFFVISMIGRFLLPLTAGSSYGTQILLQTLLIVPLTLIFCAVFFLVIERPFMMWRPRKIRAAVL